MGKRVTILFVMLLSLTGMFGCANQGATKKEQAQTKTPPAKPPAQEQTGEPREKITISLTGARNGCNDCHAPGKVIKTSEGKEKDVSLYGETKQIPNHPDVDKNSKIADCMICHKKTPQLREKFVNKVHDVHMNSKTFREKYKQTCSGCHDMSKVKGL